jgi:HicB family
MLCQSGVMDLMPHVDSLGRELLTVAETGGDAAAVIERLTVSMESAIRLTLLQALSAAADEITRDLAPGSVQVRLRGRDLNFVVTVPQGEQSFGDTADHGAAPIDDAAADLEDGPAVRFNVRLPEQLKTAIEKAAAEEGRSLNTWLVRAASAALRAPVRDHSPERPGKRSSRHYTGWAR